jgi:hypothetical protein
VKDLYVVSKLRDRLEQYCYHHHIGEPYTYNICELNNHDSFCDDGSLDADRGRIGERSHNADSNLGDRRVTDNDEDTHQDVDVDVNIDDEHIDTNEDCGKDFLLFCQQLTYDSLSSFRYDSQDRCSYCSY